MVAARDDINCDFDDDKLLEEAAAMQMQREGVIAPDPADEFKAPEGTSQETHSLVMQTLAGGDAYARTRQVQADAQLEALRKARLAAIAEARRVCRGNVLDVTANEMLHTIKTADDGVAVIVYVVDPEVADCARLDAAMVDLSVRFRSPSDCRHVGRSPPMLLRLFADDCHVDSAMRGAARMVDQDALPAILIYRARELVAHSTNVKIGDADDLEDHLDEHGTFG
ncbi:hypothetical protein M885DRAFT_622379 [Pelagophyceae sp. CCMP2097]|nr:hypothetical protein M885DRAFT_622379 [Pelagophyceae sp. CCMP2097]